MGLLRSAVCALLFLNAAVDLAAQKALHWRQLHVQARLDAEGRLHVAERHAMVFNGDWNGGERVFDVHLGQKLALEQISRIDSQGISHPLNAGDLSRVDDWKWHDSTTLRWRSRQPSDPPFENQEIVYLIEYTMSNVLRPEGERYRLDHDFAFPARAGVIEHFTLQLDFDGAWSPDRELGRLERANLPPGSGFVVDTSLRYLSDGRPAAVYAGASSAVAYGLAALLVIAVVFLVARFYLEEKKAGRFEPLLSPDQIDEDWLKENIFRHPPEVVGATWDERTAAAEVAAVLARMTAEGKLKSRIESGGILRGNELHLTLMVDRETLKGYEAALIKSLFFAGNETSTRLIREHYRNRGFDPASKIREPLSRLASRLRAAEKSSGNRRANLGWKPIVVMIVVAIALLVLAAFEAEQNIIGAAAAPGIIFVLLVFGLIGATIYRRQVSNLPALSLAFMVPVLILTTGVGLFLVVASRAIALSAWLLLGLVLLAVAMVAIVLSQAASGVSGTRWEVRRRFAAAREFFKRELRRHQPKLNDEWFPYLLAFGLGPHIDRWFKAVGGSAVASSQTFSTHSSSGSSSGSHWTGGGGAFGGAGASGTWAVAAGALAAGVSTPSSSGGGGGGGGGGSSSGGGGGGGW